MADEADRADEQQEELLRRRIAYLSSQTSGPDSTGACLNCGSKLPIGRRWCDHDCLADWEKRRSYAA